MAVRQRPADQPWGGVFKRTWRERKLAPLDELHTPASPAGAAFARAAHASLLGPAWRLGTHQVPRTLLRDVDPPGRRAASLTGRTHGPNWRPLCNTLRHCCVDARGEHAHLCWRSLLQADLRAPQRQVDEIDGADRKRTAIGARRACACTGSASRAPGPGPSALNSAVVDRSEAHGQLECEKVMAKEALQQVTQQQLPLSCWRPRGSAPRRCCPAPRRPAAEPPTRPAPRHQCPRRRRRRHLRTASIR